MFDMDDVEESAAEVVNETAAKETAAAEVSDPNRATKEPVGAHALPVVDTVKDKLAKSEPPSITDAGETAKATKSVPLTTVRRYFLEGYRAENEAVSPASAPSRLWDPKNPQNYKLPGRKRETRSEQNHQNHLNLDEKCDLQFPMSFKPKGTTVV